MGKGDVRRPRCGEAVSCDISTAVADGSASYPREGDGVPERPLVLGDLLNDFATLASLLARELCEGQLLDAFLLAAGAKQVFEDHVHPEVRTLRWLDEELNAKGRTSRRGSRAALGMLEAGSALRGMARRRKGSDDLGRWLDHAVGTLAHALMGGPPISGKDRQELAVQAGALIGKSSSLAREILRPPSCFRSFDQRPEDLGTMAAELAKRWPRSDLPISVVGVRTSGSYLAPLTAAALEANGYANVTSMTIRPGASVPGSVSKALRSTARAGGKIVLVDDPPLTGASLAAAVRALERLGAPREHQVVMVALLEGHDSLPASLDGVARVTLPWERWHVHHQLAPGVVLSSLQELTGRSSPTDKVVGSTLTEVDRGHVLARFSFECLETGGPASVDVAVEGTGIGYFGRQAVPVAQGIEGLVPHVYGWKEGLLYREWLPGESHSGEPTEELLSGIALHVAARGAALAAPRDRSMEVRGRQAVWEVAVSRVALVLGRFAIPLRRLLVEPVVRPLLAVEQPCLVDGRDGIGKWFARDATSPAVKVDFFEGSFGHRDLACYDSVFDLAGAAVAVRSSAMTRRLRAKYEEVTASPIDEERWLLYQLVHFWDAERLGRFGHEEVVDGYARAVSDFFAARFLWFGDAEEGNDGPCCAVDLDGVLETDPLGFPATTRAGAMALRALLAHSYRPLLATGRSLSEVIARCESYGLQGGVGEYGAMAYDRATSTVLDLVPPSGAQLLDAARALLSKERGVQLDPRYSRMIRASKHDQKGRLAPLDPETLAKVLSLRGDGVSLHHIDGDSQTDLVVSGLHKGMALRMLLERLDRGGDGRLALAVGDTLADAPVFELADLRIAPGNASASLRASGIAKVVRPQFQRGLQEAVSHLIGHPPGGCQLCAPPQLSPREEMFLQLLSVREGAGLGGVTRLLWLMVQQIGRGVRS